MKFLGYTGHPVMHHYNKIPVSVGKIGTTDNRQAVVMETFAGEEKPFINLDVQT